LAFKANPVDRDIVESYYPRDTRSNPDIIVPGVAERCMRCDLALSGASGIAHIWRLRSGIVASNTLLTLCDGCDDTLRPHAFATFSFLLTVE
jgi:hypothetical protein